MPKKGQQDYLYPKGEEACTVYADRNHNELFLLTRKPLTGFYTLYEIRGDGLFRLGKSSSPIELEEKFDVKKRMGCE